jgi:hypothetical protein
VIKQSCSEAGFKENSTEGITKEEVPFFNARGDVEYTSMGMVFVLTLVGLLA